MYKLQVGDIIQKIKIHRNSGRPDEVISEFQIDRTTKMFAFSGNVYKLSIEPSFSDMYRRYDSSDSHFIVYKLKPLNEEDILSLGWGKLAADYIFVDPKYGLGKPAFKISYMNKKDIYLYSLNTGELLSQIEVGSKMQLKLLMEIFNIKLDNE